MYNYGAIGNCQINALINDEGSVDWLCLPKPDSPPFFGKLLDESGGYFKIFSPQKFKSEQHYLTNTNILETVVTLSDQSQFKITDFCPRFEQHGRMYRPPTLVRKVTPLSGAPLIQVDCRPVAGWEKKPLEIVQGNSHVQFQPCEDKVRLTTNMPLTFLNSGHGFILTEEIYFVLSWGLPFEADLKTTVEDFLSQTERYWIKWVKHSSIPTLYQAEVIRSALILKLHCFEDTGAILASLTTSLPEEVGHVRNWDYRFCWLRDAYFSLSAFRNLGHFEETEGFVRFMLGIATASKADALHPVYRLDGTLPIPELLHENWSGFKNSQPVRSGNDAGNHVQNDVYGEMILVLAPLFFDERFIHLRSERHKKLLAGLVKQCISTIGVDDAGVWEFRSKWQVHSFSTLLCWAGIERIERLCEMGHDIYDLSKLKAGKKKAEEWLLKSVVDGSVRNSNQDPSFDASLSLMSILRYADKDLSKKTIHGLYEKLSIKEEAKIPAFLYRYLKQDDFGKPHSAFLACSLWAASAFAAVGEKKLASQIVERSFEARNSLGLYSEHYDPANKLQLGNFPQAYSHVGLINAAFAVSPPWSEIV